MVQRPALVWSPPLTGCRLLEPTIELRLGGALPDQLQVVVADDLDVRADRADPAGVAGAGDEDDAVAGAAILIVEVVDVGRAAGEQVGADARRDAGRAHRADHRAFVDRLLDAVAV